MISFSIAARTGAKPCVSSLRSHAAANTLALRFLSLKKTDGEVEETTPTKKALAAMKHNSAPTKLEAGATPEKKTTRAKKAKETRASNSGKFLPFNKLPKPPREITDMPLDQFYAKVYMRDLPERPEITALNVFAYKFEIPSQFIRAKSLHKGSKQLLPLGSFEPAHNILEFRLDYDSNSMMKTPEHPLKESITGMFVSNPLMESIDNDFLWDLYPKGKSFGHAPFGDDPSFNGFRNWEDAENSKVKEREAQFETKLSEMKDFNSTLNETKSFYRKPAAAAAEKKAAVKADAPDVPNAPDAQKSVGGGRKKLDRNLLKQYRKYKKEGWLRRRHERDDDDDDLN